MRNPENDDIPHAVDLARTGDPPRAVTVPGTGRYEVSTFERLSFAALAAIAIVYVANVFMMLPERATTLDFSHYYASATVLREGGNPYTTDLRPLGARLGIKVDEINRGTYTPTFLWCFALLTRLPLRSAFFVWQALSIACLAAGLVLLMRGTVSLRTAAWLTLGVVFFAPMQLHLAFSQSQFVVFLLLVLAIRALEQSRDAEGGLILAAAALLRAYAPIRSRWPDTWWCGGTGGRLPGWRPA